MVEGKTKTLTKLTSQDIYKIWGAKNPPYEHLVNIETKNRLTANDAAIDATADVAALKTNQTCDIFRLLEQKDIKTAFISQKNDNNFIARECEMLPYECVTRRIAFGSFLKRIPNIQSGFRFDDLYSEFFYKLAVVPSRRYNSLAFDSSIISGLSLVGTTASL
jgi:phosphoribosylaminoimidazole-succinocarboxamide synthase